VIDMILTTDRNARRTGGLILAALGFAVLFNIPASAGTPVTQPVTHMLQVTAATTIPQHPIGNGLIPPDEAPMPEGTPPIAGDPAHNVADMAALTQTASANLSALVAGLKAACPAGGKC
jgi:hypothetical protein